MKLLKSQKGNALSQSKGFTLIELLVVIGILAVLLAITLIAINPARQFQQANDTKRRSDVNAILNAVNQYMADKEGDVPVGITAVSQTIADPDIAVPDDGADICGDLVPTYIAALPTDPTIGDAEAVTEANCDGVYNTGYTIIQDATSKRITVAATPEIAGAVISVTR